jgi:acetyl esterase/lipase
VVAIHGGYWRSRYSLDHLGHFCAALTGMGIASWNLEYRRTGDAGGGWPGTFEDVAAGTQFLLHRAESFGVNAGRVVLLGHSAGGHLASWLGSRDRVPGDSDIAGAAPRVRGVVSLAGVLDLDAAWSLHLSDQAVVELLGGAPDEVPERYRAASPLALVPAIVQHLIVHGTSDEVVPYTVSERYQRAALAAGQSSTLLRLEEADHFDLIDPESAVWPEIASAIRRMLGLA